MDSLETAVKYRCVLRQREPSGQRFLRLDLPTPRRAAPTLPQLETRVLEILQRVSANLVAIEFGGEWRCYHHKLRASPKRSVMGLHPVLDFVTAFPTQEAAEMWMIHHGAD